jgi:BlaI family transcriptional regulator, penicillinase repressor
MADITPFTGELQTQVMSAVWRLGGATVEQVRGALPARYRGAYNTIQTVLNRLAERGLLSRHKAGSVFEYRPRVSEAEYLSRSISQVLAGASMDARQAALARLIGNLDKGELADLQKLARELDKKRRKR